MADEPDPEASISLEKMLTEITQSVATASAGLRETFARDPAWQHAPHVYHLANMKASIQLTLSRGKSSGSGIFASMFRRRGSTKTNELVSSLELDLIAVPPPAPPRIPLPEALDILKEERPRAVDVIAALASIDAHLDAAPNPFAETPRAKFVYALSSAEKNLDIPEHLRGRADTTRARVLSMG